MPKVLYKHGARLYDKVMHLSRYSSTVKNLVRTMRLDVPENARILDLGCGTGIITEVLTQRFPKSQITGFDCSEDMLKIYLKKFPKTKAVKGDFNQETVYESYPGGRPVRLKPSTFDLIISSGSVSEYGGLDRVLPLIRRLLKKDGRYVNIGVRKNIYCRIMSGIWRYKPAGKRGFMSACREAGFSEARDIQIPLSLFPTNYLKYAVIARR